MASRLPRVMLHADASNFFEYEILPAIRFAHERDGQPDWIARSEAWSNWIDSLCEGRRISTWQCKNWSHPRCCGD